MSGPGGPAKSSVAMTPPSGVTGARAMQQIKANVSTMIDKGASESEIDDYLAHEGVTAENLKTSPVARPGQITGATPVASAYNPSTTQRAADLATARHAGGKAPMLPANASPFQRAMDWMDSFGDATDTAARGFTLGLSDEAAGAGRAAGAALKGGDAGKAFQEGSDALNARIASFKDANPVLGYSLEGLGMAASPLSRIGAEWQQGGGSMLNRGLRAGAVGAGVGAATGAAYNEGGLGDRLEGAALGGAIGAPLGLALAPAIEMATRTGQSFTDVINARRAAANDPMERARRMVAEAIARDQNAPNPMTPFPQQGEALVSAGGPNLQALGRQATVAPGSARAVASDYFQGAAADMPDVIGQSVQQNVSGNRLLPTIEALDRQQRAASGPAYDAFYALSPDAFDTPYFRNLMGGSIGRGLVRDAYQLAEIERAGGLIPDNPMQYLLDAEGNVTLNQAPSARAVDMMKRALDQKVAENTDPVTQRIVGALGHQWDRLRRSFITSADAASTVDGTSLFETARAAYSGPAQLKTAANLGANALKGGQLTSEKAQAFQNLSAPEQEAFRTGLAEALIERAGQMGPNTDPVQLFLKGRNANDLMRLYMGDQNSFESFVRTLQQQSRIVKASRSVMGGSPTAPRLAENADAAAQEEQLLSQLSMAKDAWNLATGGGGGRASAAGRLLARGQNAVSGVSEPVADELGRLLFSPDSAANLATVRSAAQAVPQIQAQTAAQRALQQWLATHAPLPSAPVGAFVGSH